ncbi:hypothetical protein GT030_18265 [Streptomyces sp. SID1328]|uniref:hypothetical protein n=1 Tax=Streptomyces sp. SID1328 TaxID=2690250 RepID=UPI00136F9479|nr:hypothetical protein [Streptomyces sp. SID1328]MYV40760.1 hypothetical protein [Streptomyces sp. SID1328]
MLRRVGPDNNPRLLELDDRIRVYRIEPALIEGLQRAFALADAPSDQRPARHPSPWRSVQLKPPMAVPGKRVGWKDFSGAARGGVYLPKEG